MVQRRALACALAVVWAAAACAAARPAFLTLPGEKPDDFKGARACARLDCRQVAPPRLAARAADMPAAGVWPCPGASSGALRIELTWQDSARD